MQTVKTFGGGGFQQMKESRVDRIFFYEMN